MPMRQKEPKMKPNKREYAYVNASKFFANNIKYRWKGIIQNDPSAKVALQYLAENFFKSASPNGSTTFKEIEEIGSARTTTLDGIKQNFDMQFGGSINPKTYSMMWSKDHDTGYPECANIIPFCLGEVYAPATRAALVRKGNSVYFNAYSPPNIDFIRGRNIEIELFDEFMSRLFPLAEERNTFLAWLAATVCRPEWHVDWAPLIRSEQGVGKNVLWEKVLQPLVGKQNAPVTQLEKVTNQYAGEIYNSVALMIDEVYSNKKAASDKLKALITAEDVFVNKKYVPQFRQAVNINVLIASNADVPLHIEEDDRRYWVCQYIRHRESQAETAEFISRFLDWFHKEDGIQHVRNYLEKVAEETDQIFFRQMPPMTPAKLAITSEDMTATRREHLKSFILARSDYRFDIPSIQQWSIFKYLSQNDIREVMGEIGWATWKDGKWVGQRKTDIDPKKKPEVFIHPEIKRTDKPEYWTPELERQGKISLTIDEELFATSKPAKNDESWYPLKRIV